MSERYKRRRSRKGTPAPSQQGAHRKTHTESDYITDRAKVHLALLEGPKTLDQLRRQLNMASPASRISELIMDEVPVLKRFIPHVRKDGKKAPIMEYWIEAQEVDHD